MTEEEIKQTWKRLITPIIIGIVLLLVGVLWHRLGSKRSGFQVISFFVGLLGSVFIVLPGLKAMKFRKFLKSKK
jgi:uncharacterized membrane protein YiaA